MKRRNKSTADIGRYILIMMLIMLIFLMPLKYFADMEAETAENAVQMKIDELTGRAKLKKQITREDYEELVEYLTCTGMQFDIDLSVGRYQEDLSIYSKNDVGSGFLMMSKMKPVAEWEIVEETSCDCVSHGAEAEDCATHVHSQNCYIGHNHQAAGCSFDGVNWSCGINENDLTPICGKVVTDVMWAKTQVIPSGRGQKLSEGGNFDNRLYVTYLDGTTAIVEATVIAFDDLNVGNRTVTMLYNAYYVTAKNAKETKTFTVNLSVVTADNVCPVCGTRYDYDAHGKDGGCPVCSQTLTELICSESNINGATNDADLLNALTYTAVYKDGHTEEVAAAVRGFNSAIRGTQIVTVTFTGTDRVTYTYGGTEYHTDITDNEKSATVTVMLRNYYNCPVCFRTYPDADDGSDPGCPFCNNRFYGIRIIPQKTEYVIGEPLEITVYAMSRLGDVEVPYGDWSCDYNPNRTGNQMVTVDYEGFTDVVSVMVADPNMLVCPICGNPFDSRLFTSCPICSADLVAVEASAVPEVYSYGEELMLTVWAVYRSGERVLLTSGYDVVGYNEYYTADEQTVTITYQGVSDTVTVKVREREALPANIVVCENGHYYELNPDGSDPGCPYCSGTPADAGASREHHIDMMYNSEIIDALYSTGYVELGMGDTYSIVLRVISEGTSVRVGRALMPTRINKQIFTSGIVIGDAK